MSKAAIIRPAWTPATITLMVIGFIVFWPLGLAMLAYILWGDRLGDVKSEFASWRDGVFGARGAPVFHARTGNVAFDEWREKEMERIEEERRRLDAAREEFDSYLRELRRAKDQEEFDRFMADRTRTAPARRGGRPGKTPLED